MNPDLYAVFLALAGFTAVLFGISLLFNLLCEMVASPLLKPDRRPWLRRNACIATVLAGILISFLFAMAYVTQYPSSPPVVFGAIIAVGVYIGWRAYLHAAPLFPPPSVAHPSRNLR